MIPRIAGATSSALALALVLTACSGDDGRRAATTTTTVPVSTSTTAIEPGVTDTELLAGVAAGSVVGADLLPDDRWVAGVRRGCADLGTVPDDQIDDFFELFRIQVEDEGGSREQSLAAVQSLVGGLLVACPVLGARLEPLIPDA